MGIIDPVETDRISLVDDYNSFNHSLSLQSYGILLNLVPFTAGNFTPSHLFSLIITISSPLQFKIPSTKSFLTSRFHYIYSPRATKVSNTSKTTLHYFTWFYTHKLH